MSLAPNTSAFSRPIAMAMNLKKACPELVDGSFVLKAKHIQLILTLVFKSLR